MSLLCSRNTILCRKRWLNVETNRYLQEQQDYITSVCEAAEEILASIDPKDHHIPIQTQRFLFALHADALVVLFEYFVTFHPRSLFSSMHGKDSGGCEASPLCEILLAALAKRSVELSSKHVAFIGALYSASNVDARLFPFMLYHSRHSLRRTQAVQALRTISVMRLSALDSMTDASIGSPLGIDTHGTSLYTSALSSLMVRCMELEPTHEGYDTRALLSQVLMRHYSHIHPDIRTACHWWIRRDLQKSDETFYLPVLQVKLDNAPLPADAFPAMGRASRSLTLPVLEAVYLRLLFKKDSTVEPFSCVDSGRAMHVTSVSSTSASEVRDPALLLHQQLPTLERLHGELKLLALETLSRRVLEITQLDAVVGLAESVLRYAPSLSGVVVHRILQLECIDGQGAAAVSTLTAMHRLLPHVNVMDVVEGFMMYGDFSRVSSGSGKSATTVSPADAFVKCLAMYIPVKFLPAMFHRLCRQRELAAFRLSPFVLRVLLQALEYVAPYSLSRRDVMCIQDFIQQERRKALLHSRHCTLATKTGEEKEKLSNGTENELLAAMEACVMLRCRVPKDNRLPQLPPTPNSLTTDSCKAVSVAKAALVSLFGVKATTLVTTEAAVRERASLAWLYAMYRMSVSIICELEALAALALRQGAQLRVNRRQRTLVELSESVDENDLFTEVHLQLLAGGMDALRVCVEEWLLKKETRSQSLKRLGTLLEEDTALVSFLCYAAMTCHDTTAMEELRLRVPVANVIFAREDFMNSTGMYAMPSQSLRKTSEVFADNDSIGCHSVSSNNSISSNNNSSCSSNHVVANGRGNTRDNAAEDVDTQKGSCAPDLRIAAMSALRFAKEHWRNETPAAVDAVCLWAQVDLLLLEKECSRKLECYEAMLQLCRTNRLAERVPAVIHREAFTVIGGKGLWAQGVELLRLAEGISKESQVPVEAYQQVMRACLMHRIPVPDFLREKIKPTASV